MPFFDLPFFDPWDHGTGSVVYTDRDNRQSTTTVDHTARSSTISYSDYTVATFFAGDGTPILFADETPGTEFNNGTTQVQLSFDSIGRQIEETTILDFAQVSPPSSHVSNSLVPRSRLPRIACRNFTVDEMKFAGMFASSSLSVAAIILGW